MINFIPDIPYDFHQYVNTDTPVFFLAQHFEEYKNTALLKLMENKGIFLDNGSWDYRGAMKVDDYIKVCKKMSCKWIVVPDVLGDMENTKVLAKKFFDNYGKYSSNTIFIFPLQGKNITELDEILKWYRVNCIQVDYYFAMSKGLPEQCGYDRTEIINALQALNFFTFRMHWFGYNFGDVPSTIDSIDTGTMFRKILRNIDVKDYYTIKWNDISDQQKIAVVHWLREYQRLFK